jgi:hypothetical protein
VTCADKIGRVVTSVAFPTFRQLWRKVMVVFNASKLPLLRFLFQARQGFDRDGGALRRAQIAALAVPAPRDRANRPTFKGTG